MTGKMLHTVNDAMKKQGNKTGKDLPYKRLNNLERALRRADLTQKGKDLMLRL